MELEIDRHGVVVPVRIDPAGLVGPTIGQARGSRWRRTSPGLVVPSWVDSTNPAQRIVEAAAGATDGAAVTGWAALLWMGARWFGGCTSYGERLPVPLAIGDKGHLARRRGVRFVYDWMFDGDIVLVDGLPITRSERSVCSAVLRTRRLEDAVRIIDMAAADDLIDRAELRRYAERIKGRPHTVRLRQAIDLAEENVWSPQEVTLRMCWSGLFPRNLVCNAPVFDLSGNHLITPDVFDPAAGVAGEYNGAIHDGADLRRRDLVREDLYRDLGIEVVTMMSTDLRDRTAFEHRLMGAYARSASHPSGRSWTLEQPTWWVDTSSVAKRRALDETERQIWLPHRGRSA